MPTKKFFTKRRYPDPNPESRKFRLFQEAFGKGYEHFEILGLFIGTNRANSSVTGSSSSRLMEIVDKDTGEVHTIGPGEYGVYVWRIWGEPKQLAPRIVEAAHPPEMVTWETVSDPDDPQQGQAVAGEVMSEVPEDTPDEVEEVLQLLKGVVR